VRQPTETEGWALLGPDRVSPERRVRALEVAPAVRAYNDAAVPGLGGVWFCKPLVLALAGIALANRLGLSAVPVANAIEALGCGLAINYRNAPRDARLRGRQKLAGKRFPSYVQASRPNYYVTQPMRQQTVQPLRALGLVESTPSDRFNAYRVSPSGQRLLEAAFHEHKPFNSSVLGVLAQWISGKDKNYENSEFLARALSPVEPLAQPARNILREQFVGGDAQRGRRAAALAWVRDPGAEINDWSRRPLVIDEAHWADLHAGACFFATRDAALRVLQHIEIHLTRSPSRRHPITEHWQALDEALDALRVCARSFLDRSSDTSPGNMATQFCRECADDEPERLLRSLIRRDDRVLRVSGNDIVTGTAFQATEQGYGSVHDNQDDDVAGTTGLVRWPEGISHRIPNLHLFAADLDGRLDALLRPREDRA